MSKPTSDVTTQSGTVTVLQPIINTVPLGAGVPFQINLQWDLRGFTGTATLQETSDGATWNDIGVLPNGGTTNRNVNSNQASPWPRVVLT